MLIDWFTVVAQALNFLVLVWLMKRYLYQPVLQAIDAREKLIAGELADADSKQKEAQKQQHEFEQKNDELDKKHASLLAKVTKDAHKEGQRLLESAKGAADEQLAKRQTELAAEAGRLYEAVGLRTRQEVFAIARKALTDLASASLEERLTDVFIRRLSAMDDKAKSLLAEALHDATEPATVRTSFELSAVQCAAIREAVNVAFSADVAMRFESSPELVSGIELSSNGQKLGWSIADYLSAMEASVGELVGMQAVAK
jgi:F-type H+-transporting ATPase subunit b